MLTQHLSSICRPLSHPRLRTLATVLLALAVFSTVTAADDDAAQQQLELDRLANGKVRKQIGLSDEQSQKVAEILKKSKPGSDVLMPYLNKLKAHADDRETLLAIRKDMIQELKQNQAAAANAIREILSEDQKTKLQNFVAAEEKSKPGTFTFRQYSLKNIDARDAEKQVRAQLQGIQKGHIESPKKDSSGGESPKTSPQAQVSPAEGFEKPHKLRLLGDSRTNSLLVTATTAQHELVGKLVEALDTVQASKKAAGVFLERYEVNDPKEIAETLRALNLPGVLVVNEDGRNRRIHIIASEQKHKEVAELIRKLNK